MYAVDEDDGENAEESTENDEDLQAWCLLEESENEQWQEVISKHNKRNVKKANPASLLRVENNHNSNPKKIVEETDKWVKVRVAMDSGAAGHVMPEAMFPMLSLSAKRHQRSLWPQMESKANTWVRKIPFKTSERIQMCITFRSANNVKHLISMQKVVRAGNTVVLDERDGTVIKLDVSNAVCTMDMWICLDERGPVFSWQGQ